MRIDQIASALEDLEHIVERRRDPLAPPGRSPRLPEIQNRVRSASTKVATTLKSFARTAQEFAQLQAYLLQTERWLESEVKRAPNERLSGLIEFIHGITPRIAAGKDGVDRLAEELAELKTELESNLSVESPRMSRTTPDVRGSSFVIPPRSN